MEGGKLMFKFIRNIVMKSFEKERKLMLYSLKREAKDYIGKALESKKIEHEKTCIQLSHCQTEAFIEAMQIVLGEVQKVYVDPKQNLSFFKIYNTMFPVYQDGTSIPQVWKLQRDVRAQESPASDDSSELHTLPESQFSAALAD